MPQSELLYGFESVSSALGGMSRSTLSKMEAEGRLPVFRIGRKICAHRSALDEWLRKQSQKALEAA